MRAIYARASFLASSNSLLYHEQQIHERIQNNFFVISIRGCAARCTHLLRGRLESSVAGKHGQAAGRRRLPVPPQPERVAVCLVAHVCLHRRTGPVLAHRSFWTLGKVALLTVGAHRERTHQNRHDGRLVIRSCRKRGAHGLVMEEMTVSAASDCMTFMTNRKDNKSVNRPGMSGDFLV